MTNAASNIARKFEFLQDRAQRRPIRESSVDVSGDAAKKTNIGHLKEFYLQRLAKSEPNTAARLGAQSSFPVGDAAQPQASGQHAVRPGFIPGAPRDIEDLEVMCNNCFNLIRSSEASQCTGDKSCPLALRAGTTGTPAERPSSTIALLDLKLQKLRAALEARLQDSSSKVNVMRHLTQLRYHIDTAAKWVPGCSEIGALSDHTVQQVKQLTTTSRVIAPAVYIFSKRIENVVVQKERELRRAMVQSSASRVGGVSEGVTIDIDRDAATESVADVNSIVSELDSDCGTQYAETLVTQDGPSTDVGNVQDANDYLSLKNEDEQRRWFYSQCLTVKLACPDKTRARKTLISDLYAAVRAQNVPIESWVQWIRMQLMPEEAGAAQTQASCTTGGACGSGMAGQDLDRTTPVPSGGISNMGARHASLLESLQSRAQQRPEGVAQAAGSAHLPRTSMVHTTFPRKT